MSAHSSSVEPSSTTVSVDTVNQRVHEKETLKDQTSHHSGNKNHKEEEEIYKARKAEKRILDLEQMKSAERVDRSTILLSILFYIFLYIGQSSISDKFKKFYTLQYRYEGTNVYDNGWDDIYFMLFSVINLLFLRSFMIIYVFKPCARIAGITKFKDTQRFIEQAWSIIYYSFSWGFGFYLYYISDYYFDCYNIYANWPHDQMSMSFKLYYLIQTASWFEQLIVLQLEEKRKDYYQMFAHHIVTCLLCTGSYAYYLTKIGHIFLLQMDIVDIFLSTAKILKYSGFQTICDILFIVFMLLWIVLRHIVYNYVLWFSWAYSKVIINASSRFSPGEVAGIYSTIDFLLLLLVVLQIITCFWMYLILRVAYRVITGGSADDVRSDSD